MMAGSASEDRRQRRFCDGTTGIAMSWVLLAVYGFLCFAAASPSRLEVWITALTILVVAWSVMERKRWGRFALLGIAACRIVDAAYALYRLYGAAHGSAFATPYVLRAIEQTYFGSLAYGLLLLLLCAVTLAWLLRQSVRVEFDVGKRMATRRWQITLAVLLTGICGLNTVREGVSRNARGLWSAPSPIPWRSASWLAANGTGIRYTDFEH